MSKSKLDKENSKRTYSQDTIRSHLLEYFLHEENIDDFHTYDDLHVYVKRFPNGNFVHVFQIFSPKIILDCLSQMVDSGTLEVAQLNKRKKMFRISREYMKIQFGIDLDESGESCFDKEGEDESLNRKLSSEEENERQEAYNNSNNSNDDNVNEDMLDANYFEEDIQNDINSDNINTDSGSELKECSIQQRDEREDDNLNSKLSPQELDSLEHASKPSLIWDNNAIKDMLNSYEITDEMIVFDINETEDERKIRVLEDVRQLVDVLLTTPGVDPLVIRQLLYYFDTKDPDLLHFRFVGVFNALQFRGYKTLREGCNVSRVHDIVHRVYKLFLLREGIPLQSSRYNEVELIFQRTQTTYMDLLESLPADDPLIDLFISGIRNPKDVEIDGIDHNNNEDLDNEFKFNAEKSLDFLDDTISPVKMQNDKVAEESENSDDDYWSVINDEEDNKQNNSEGSVMKDDVSGNSEAFSNSVTYTGSHQSDRDFISLNGATPEFDLSLVSSKDVSEVTDKHEDLSLITAEVGKRQKRKKTYSNYEDDMSLFSKVSSHQRINTPERDSSYILSNSDDNGENVSTDELLNDSGVMSDLTK